MPGSIDLFIPLTHSSGLQTLEKFSRPAPAMDQLQTPFQYWRKNSLNTVLLQCLG